jgi:hypothetical protein
VDVVMEIFMRMCDGGVGLAFPVIPTSEWH